MIGNKYGRLTVLSCVGKDKWRKTKWNCLCECGNEVVVNRSNLGRTTFSCGCLRKETMRSMSSTHKLSKHKLYDLWNDIKKRCYNTKSISYKYYGAKGIRLHDDWLDFKTFYDWSIKNGYTEGLSIERDDIKKNYEPDNCRWIKREEQALNTSRSRKYEVDGELKSLSQICREHNVPYPRTLYRLDNGSTLEEAINIGVGEWKQVKRS